MYSLQYDIRGKMREFGLGMDYGHVKLAPHNDKWADAFNEINEYITYRLESQSIWRGQDFRVKHIGSTSLPIMAKPVLDFAVVCMDGDAMRAAGARWSIRSTLCGSIGFESSGHLHDLKNQDLLAYLHLHSSPNWELTEQLLFKKFMLEHPETAKEYEQLKIQSAVGKPNYKDYSDKKYDFVNKINQKAFKEYGEPTHDEVLELV